MYPAWLGASEGETFNLRNEGNRMAGQTGDLMITVSVEKSDTFTRKRNDIYTTVTVSLLQALKGASVIVPTVSGDVEMRIPSGTQPDDIKRLNGRGIHNATTREQGHQFVKIKVEIPRNLTSTQMELLERSLDPNYRPTASPSHEDTRKDGATDQEEKTGSKWLDRLRSWLKW